MVHRLTVCLDLAYRLDVIGGLLLSEFRKPVYIMVVLGSGQEKSNKVRIEVMPASRDPKGT